MQADFITNCLRSSYQIEATAVTLLEIGADVNASIYKVHGQGQTYFVKLKRGPFNIGILELLEKMGIQQLIPPIKTIRGEQVHQEGDLTVIVYPFVEGRDGFSRALTDVQWVALGRALRRVHEVVVPASFKIRREEFSPKWREAVRALYAHRKIVANDEFAVNLWKFLQDNKSVIQRLVNRSEELSQRVLKPKFVLCHSDVHAGNVLVNGHSIYIVDWDDPILAPKERDLMFIGGGVGNVWNQPREEILFYQGYGQVQIDATLIAYYRYERIVEDIAEYCEELLLKQMEGNRLEMYRQFISMFEPGGVVDIACAEFG